MKEGRDRRHSDEVFDLLELDDTTTGGGIRWIHRRLEDDDEHSGQRDRPRIYEGAAPGGDGSPRWRAAVAAAAKLGLGL